MYENCYKCGSDLIEKRNIITEIFNGELLEVEYNIYCANCGQYLESFNYGNWEE